MATLVLVHGGWVGGWVWQRVSRRLRAAGHEVYTPTLTGLGERVHLGHPDIDLACHILDIVNVLEAEDLHDVVLAGHSYGGMVITGVAEVVPGRLAHLVYLDGFVPQDGEALLDLLQPAARRIIEETLTRSADGWRVRWHGDPRSASGSPPTPRDTPQPWKTFSQPLAITNTAAAALPRTYVRATADKAPGEFTALSFERSWQRAQARPWRRREVAVSHGALVAEPAAAALLDLFPGPGSPPPAEQKAPGE